MRLPFSKLLKADGHSVKKTCGGFMCNCPFHEDGTPSFSIFPTDDYAKCFGCDWKGDIINYQMDFHHLDFGAALEALQQKAGEIGSPLTNLTAAPTAGRIVPAILIPEQIEVSQAAVKRLQDDEHLWTSIATKRACDLTPKKWT